MINIKEQRQNRIVLLKIANLSKMTRAGIRQGFFRLGNDLKKTASKQILKKPKSGRVYLIRRGKITRRHVASAPYESPANLSGDYRKTIDYKIVGTSRLIFGAGSSKVKYAKYLELGTKNMLPRRGLGNAVEAVQKNAVQYFSNGISGAIK